MGFRRIIGLSGTGVWGCHGKGFGLAKSVRTARPKKEPFFCHFRFVGMVEIPFSRDTPLMRPQNDQRCKLHPWSREKLGFSTKKLGFSTKQLRVFNIKALVFNADGRAGCSTLGFSLKKKSFLRKDCGFQRKGQGSREKN